MINPFTKKEDEEHFWIFKNHIGDTLKSPQGGYPNLVNPNGIEGLWALMRHNPDLKADTFFPTAQITWIRNTRS